MATASPTLFWFRDDLRLGDNPGLAAACEGDAPLILLYVLDDSGDGPRPLGGAARWWLHHSLTSLSADLAKLGQRLVIRRGAAERIVPDMVRRTGTRLAAWNRRYGKAAVLDDRIAAELEAAGCAVSSHSANLLHEPGEVVSGKGEPFKVYSAFWRAANALGGIRSPVGRPTALLPPAERIDSDSLDSLGLLPTRPDWSGGLQAIWQPGEGGAKARLDGFLSSRLEGYAERRDLPAEPATSMLSPHLRFGEISPVQIWRAISDTGADAARFTSELGWREFAYHVLAEAPDCHRRNLREAFDRFPWHEPEHEVLRAWQRGRTGYPIVDAGMRQLWQTGWMHNRVRMVVGSFLTKHLLIDWRHGESWFWDTLVDADPANNPFGWQWVAGSGYDAQPFFRIFNPVLQGEKFDPDGAYIRCFVPEIAALPDRFIHKPWEATPIELRSTGLVLGTDYPRPIVDHGAARERALAAYKAMRR